MPIGLKTLVLNSNYMPISLAPLQTILAEDAVTRILNGTCHTVFEYDRKILTPTLDMNWPSVIARNSHDQIKNRVALKRSTLYYRDHGICQYCERSLTLKEATYDHVMPRGRGGKHEWKNVVVSCTSCNGRKGLHLPVGIWKPKQKPFEPTYFDIVKSCRSFPITLDDPNWESFIGDWTGDILIREAA